jgi:hypothetical protein
LPIANVFASLPITLNGLGVREAAYLVLFGYVGLARSDTIALGLLWFASTLLGGLTGIFAFVTTNQPAASEVGSSRAFGRWAISPGVAAGRFEESTGGTVGRQERQTHCFGRSLRNGLMTLMPV